MWRNFKQNPARSQQLPKITCNCGDRMQKQEEVMAGIQSDVPIILPPSNRVCQ